MQVLGLWEEAAVPLREPPQKQPGDSIKTELPCFILELATLLLRLRPARRRPYRSDGRLPSVRFCAITPAIAALL